MTSKEETDGYFEKIILNVGVVNDAIIDPTNANKIPLILTFYSCFFISKCYSMKFLSVFYVEFILIMIIKFFIDSNNLNI